MVGVNNAESSNGRTLGFGPSYLGSNPGSAASLCTPSDPSASNIPYFPSKKLFLKARTITIVYPQKTSVRISFPEPETISLCYLN